MALREAKHGFVVVTNRDKPDAVLISMEQLAGVPNLDQVRLVTAVSLFTSSATTELSPEIAGYCIGK